jgi:hypothetical protein
MTTLAAQGCSSSGEAEVPDCGGLGFDPDGSCLLASLYGEASPECDASSEGASFDVVQRDIASNGDDAREGPMPDGTRDATSGEDALLGSDANQGD